MGYKFSSLKSVLDTFEYDEKIWASEIVNRIWKSRTIVHKYLKELIKRWYIVKYGSPPYVKYQKKISTKKTTKNLSEDIFISYEDKRILDESFYKFSASWKSLIWFEGFKIWCSERGFDIKSKKNNYIKIYKYIKSIQDICWNINTTSTFWKWFKNVYLDNVYYADLYTWMEFWRWKIAETAFYSKISQNKKLIEQTLNEILYKIKCIIHLNKYDAIAIIPWSIYRKNQLLKILKDKLKNLKLPFVNIIKYSPSWIIIPQKSLKTKKQRIENAQNTIFVDNEKIYKKILLIDDFVGSWATLNKTTEKLKEKWVKQVDWYSFVWNLDLSYEIINEI